MKPNQLPLFEGSRPDTEIVKLTGTFEPSEILAQAHHLNDEVVRRRGAPDGRRVMIVRPWHLGIRDDSDAETDPSKWWVAIVGGNGETVFTTETYTTIVHARGVAAATAQLTHWEVR